MGASIPKQYLPLNDSTVIQQTLLKLTQIEHFEAIVICLSESDGWWQALEQPKDGRIEIALGGKERCDSVLNGLQHLTDKAQDQDWVLVHDVARPCVRTEDILNLIEKATEHAVGGLLAVPVRDTMKRADNTGAVSETVCRENLWHALTPQMFRFGDLKQAITTSLQAGLPITDEASAIEQQGMNPLLVEGHADNIKITHPEDLELAALFLKQQSVK